ncbi:MAG: STAS-like domain-containing protein [Chloroflexota bacterium]
MGNQVRIAVPARCKRGICVTSEAGQALYDELEQCLRRGDRVLLSFAGVEALTSAFLNAALGQLYGQFTAQEITDGITYIDAEPDDLVLLRRVAEAAKAYFAEPERHRAARAAAVGGAGA